MQKIKDKFVKSTERMEQFDAIVKVNPIFREQLAMSNDGDRFPFQKQWVFDLRL